MNMNTLRVANVARDQEWNTGSERVSMTFRATELAGEVGEACNVIKKLERERIGLVGSRDTKEHLAEELADIVICTDLVAMDAGIELDAAIAAKFNATSEKNGLSTRLSIPATATTLPFEATPAMVKAALDLVWEESETHGDLVCRLWRAMATAALNQPSAARSLPLEEAVRNLIANRFDTYKARNGKLCSIEGDDGEKCWIVSFDDMADLETALVPHPLADKPDEAGAQVEVTTAARDVLAERRRQIEAEGWTQEDDDKQTDSEMAHAAACYALNNASVWPYSISWWKPTDRRRNLVKAGALIIAEIERLDRLPTPPSSEVA